MHRYTMVAPLVASLALAAVACNRDGEKMTSTAETQTQMTQPANAPVTVEGCVKAGDAADTFVLTAARSEGSQDTSTYQLVGERAASVRDHVGHRVQVSGTLQGQQEIATRTTAKPAEQPTGTSGTPTVQTRAELDIKHLAVNSVARVSGSCDADR